MGAKKKFKFIATLHKPVNVADVGNNDMVQSEIINCDAYDRDVLGFTFYEDVERKEFIAFIANDNILAIVKQ